ncbi:MAG: hypothetical protein ED557_06185 [Balneola sp.]|nr:MAG: hypothetical protein ED557_06185 [Balneola sp.]
MLKAILTLPILSLLISFNTITEIELVTTESSEFNIEDFGWLVGTWTGDGFGGQSEETWSTPVDGTMMGMYRHYKDGKIVFYEFLLLDETGLRLKHFNPDITSWEEKDDFVSFEMVNHTKDKIELKGLVFERKSDTEMEIRLRLRNNDGEVRTEVFSMRRE